MADQGNPVDAMANIVRGPIAGTVHRGQVRPLGSQPPLPSGQVQVIGFSAVRQALDEVEKRLQGTVEASHEVMRFHARPQPDKEAMNDALPVDREDATVWENLATRCVLLSRSIETLERNLKITLDTLR